MCHNKIAEQSIGAQKTLPRQQIMTPTRSSEGAQSTAAGRSRLLHSLEAVASATTDAQLEAFAARLTEALLKASNLSADAKEAGISFNAAHLLKKNSYPFRYTVSACLKKAFQQETDALERQVSGRSEPSDDTLALVSYEEMDRKLTVGDASRRIEIENTDRYAPLGIRLAYLLARDELPIEKNPFRAEVFLCAINEAWSEFNPDVSAHQMVLPLLQPDVFLDLAPILQALNDVLIANGILPEIPDRYSIKKSNTSQESIKKDNPRDAAVREQLKHLFSPPPNGSARSAGPSGIGQAPFSSADLESQVLRATAASNQLLGYLAGVQKSLSEHQLRADPQSGPHDASFLPNIKKQAPQGALSQVDETTIDLLSKIFDVVFRDQNIPSEIKSLIGFLQVPLLKAALIDKDFFFKEEHPARRLIELLTISSVDWDQKKGQDDPLFQTIKRNVARVQHEYDQEVVLFSDVVSDIEAYLSQEESANAEQLSTPIAQALKQEKIGQATKIAKQEVALRVGTGEVVAFVETFLENKWVSVLTLAYSLKEEKPQAVEGAVKTMDDLIWSVKPKITREERKELIGKLPTMLAMLNKWLNLVKLDDAERLQFFAELAECHASIVRAPLELSPQRQLEIAIEAARQATERRLQRRASEQAEPEPDAHAVTVQQLERGTWLEFVQRDGSIKKVKLAWISPLRSLYIFSTRDRLESFSLSAEELAKTLREDRAAIVLLSGVVGRALAEALDSVGANDPVNAAQAAA